MKSFCSHPVGIEQGEAVLFSEFENGGEMWTGTGPRERRRAVRFRKIFHSPPAVQMNVSLWDVDNSSALRAEVAPENITHEGFEAVFRTWSDTRIARIRVSWMAIGEIPNEDDWNIS